MIGSPRRHLRATGSTNDLARTLAQRGAPHGTTVTTRHQQTGRGRQGRVWSTPPGQALTVSFVLRDGLDDLLPLRAALAVARVCGDDTQIKWPNDVQRDGRKLAGILAEGRPQEGWAVLGIGLNVAIDLATLPPELHATAGTLGLTPADVEPTLARLCAQLDAALALKPTAMLDAYRERDALRGREVAWNGGSGIAHGVDAEGRLLVGDEALDAGEVHLRPADEA